MASGTVQTILVCVPKAGNTPPSIAPCAQSGATHYQPAQMEAYVLNPNVTLESTVQTVPFDYGQAAAAFAFGLTMVITFWLSAKPIGAILALLRKG